MSHFLGIIIYIGILVHFLTLSTFSSMPRNVMKLEMLRCMLNYFLNQCLGRRRGLKRINLIILNFVFHFIVFSFQKYPTGNFLTPRFCFIINSQKGQSNEHSLQVRNRPIWPTGWFKFLGVGNLGTNADDVPPWWMASSVSNRFSMSYNQILTEPLEPWTRGGYKG